MIRRKIRRRNENGVIVAINATIDHIVHKRDPQTGEQRLYGVRPDGQQAKGFNWNLKNMESLLETGDWVVTEVVDEHQEAISLAELKLLLDVPEASEGVDVW